MVIKLICIKLNANVRCFSDNSVYEYVFYTFLIAFLICFHNFALSLPLII